jgi:hypothetical protein
MTAEEIDVYLVELNKIGREHAKQKRQNQRTAGRPTGSRTRRGR